MQHAGDFNAVNYCRPLMAASSPEVVMMIGVRMVGAVARLTDWRILLSAPSADLPAYSFLPQLRRVWMMVE